MRYIRADETPHVDYLRTALTEMRDRTFVGESGRKIPGTEVIGTLWDAALEQSLGANRRELRAARRPPRSSTRSRATRGRDEILEGFHALGADRECSAREVRRLLRAPAAAAVGRPTPSTG